MFAPNQILKTAAPDFLKDLDLTDGELLYLLDLAAEVKASPGDYAHALDGKNVGMLFEKPSLRTKLTFELAMKQMGGGSVFLEGPIGVREPLKDVARNLDRWVNGLVARVFLQSTVDGLAHWSRVPLITALRAPSPPPPAPPARPSPIFRPSANTSPSRCSTGSSSPSSATATTSPSRSC